MMRYEGYKVRQIAEITGMRINSISQLCRRYREQGLKEFKRNKATSHRYAMPVEKEREILARFEKAAEAGQEVTAKDIKAAFDEARGKDTGRGYIYMLLKRHGWRKVMPRPKHPKAASQEEQDSSKKLRGCTRKRQTSSLGKQSE
jgi:transposase